MAYESPNGNTNELVGRDVEDLLTLPGPRQDRVLRTAYRTVSDLAPPVPTEDYRQAARDAEVAVVEYVLATQGGIVKSKSLSGVASKSFAGNEAVVSLVRNAMGGYFGSSSVSGAALLGEVPW